MRICVVSNGPSARLYPGPDGFAQTIGVNKAVTLHPFDWWVHSDYDAFRDNVPLGNPMLFTRRTMEEKIRKWCDAATVERWEATLKAGLVHYQEDIPKRPVMPDEAPPWNSYSGTAAMILAWGLVSGHGESEVVVYGMDMKGKGDCTGSSTGVRTSHRWKHEQEILTGIEKLFRRDGIELRRIVDG